MDRTQKTEAVAELNRIFTGAGVVVVTRNLGLTVVESSELRTKMREAGARFKVAKNRLTKLAINGTQYDPISDLFAGPTALAWSDDPVAATKVVAEFAKANDRLEIVGGAMGDTVLDLDGVKSLAALPSLVELRGKIAGLLNAPATKVAVLANAPASKLARVFGAYGVSEVA